MSQNKPIIVVKDLCKSFGNLQVLKNLNLEVYEGETLVILGRSGVGKSVLLKQLLFIEPIDSGTVLVNGHNIAKMSSSKRYSVTKEMGMLFQGAALFDSLDVGENIAFYLRQHESHLPEDVIQDRVAEALKMVELQGIQRKMPSELSGGMRKRAALARLIVYRPKIVFYDEPTTGLDPITAMHINNLIIATQNELKATSIVVTHDILSATKVGDRLAFHNDGKIVQIAPKREFFNIQDEELQSFYHNATFTGVGDSKK